MRVFLSVLSCSLTINIIKRRASWPVQLVAVSAGEAPRQRKVRPDWLYCRVSRWQGSRRQKKIALLEGYLSQQASQGLSLEKCADARYVIVPGNERGRPGLEQRMNGWTTSEKIEANAKLIVKFVKFDSEMWSASQFDTQMPLWVIVHPAKLAATTCRHWKVEKVTCWKTWFYSTDIFAIVAVWLCDTAMTTFLRKP